MSSCLLFIIDFGCLLHPHRLLFYLFLAISYSVKFHQTYLLRQENEYTYYGEVLQAIRPKHKTPLSTMTTRRRQTERSSKLIRFFFNHGHNVTILICISSFALNPLFIRLKWDFFKGLRVEATAADSRDYVNDHNYHHRHLQQQQDQQERDLARVDQTDDGSNGDNNNNGVLQVIETEVWDEFEKVWKGSEESGRWTNEKGFASVSPPEVVSPEGWEFLGDWKIVVKSSNNNDSKGWEYQFQYLQPAKRRRIWLRSLTQSSAPIRKKSRSQSSQLIPKTQQTKTKVERIRVNSITRTTKRIRDDWNFKGLGFNLYKSFIFPSSIGIAVRLPLTINFDTLDRNPALPTIASSACLYFPPMIGGFLSCSVHVEWVKWVFQCIAALIPRIILCFVYRLVFPILWMAASMLLFPIKHILPSRPTKIPNKSWWTGGNISKPYYNPEKSERIGCSLSYRWSKRLGYEWRISYWHAYLPTLLVYQQFLSRLQERVRSSTLYTAIINSKSSDTYSTVSSTEMSSTSSSSATTKSKPIDWWRKHFASLGVSTSGPIPDTPPISCSANLSLSGLYWGSRKKKLPFATTIVSRTDSVSSVTGNDDSSNNFNPSDGINDHDLKDDSRHPSTKILASPMKTS